MNKYLLRINLIAIIVIFKSSVLFSTPFPDQFFEISGADSLLTNAESIYNLTSGSNGLSLVLEESEIEGYIILNSHTFEYSFNRGLPSWNSTSPNGISSSIKVEMRFYINNVWSGWLMVGYWDKYMWGNYGRTNFAHGEVDVDYVKLNKYSKTFQYKVTFNRSSSNYKSPELRRLNFSVSDSKTEVNMVDIINDKPDAIYIPTDFLYQFDIDDEIGGSICSPTTVSMIIKSYDIAVDPLEFAKRTYDTYWNLYGVWPRVVTHASEYGLKGAVTRYRTWSEAAEVLKEGGRIAMSVGKPLYSGHLIMLAGFTDDGVPIVHDPAKRKGEALSYSKSLISNSWFNKGGISYTFYKEDEITSVINEQVASTFLNVYPNPGREYTKINFFLEKEEYIKLNIYNLQGRLIKTLSHNRLVTGNQTFVLNFNDHNISDGMYIVELLANNKVFNAKFVVTR